MDLRYDERQKIRPYIKVNITDYYIRKDIVKIAAFPIYEDTVCTKPIKTTKTDAKNGIAIVVDAIYETSFLKKIKTSFGY